MVRSAQRKEALQRVRPFGFLLTYQTGALPFFGYDSPRPVSAYDRDLSKAAQSCVDRETGEPVPRAQLKSYRDTLAQYHLHPESKFHNGDYADRGFTRRRHVRAMVTEYIGKEANRWEEQLHLGLDLEAQTEYKLSPEGRESVLEAARRAADIRGRGQRELAATTGVSLSELWAVLLSKRHPNSSTLAKLGVTVSRLCRTERGNRAKRRVRSTKWGGIVGSRTCATSPDKRE